MAACTHITYAFDDLMLLSGEKFGGMPVSGKAHIAVYGDDEWHLRQLWIDGYEIDRNADAWAWNRAHAALEDQCHDDILETAATDGRDLNAAMGFRFRSVA